MAVYKGYLYIGVENRVTGAQLWRRAVAADGDWKDGSSWEVIAHGHGKGGILTNFWYSDFVEFKGKLYTGTMNFLGLEIWRLFDPGSSSVDNVTFEKVYEGATVDDPRGVAQLIVWGGHTLLVATMLREPEGAVLLSSKDGVNYLTHEPPRLIPGFSEKNYLYLWRMVEYNGRVYVSANEWPSMEQGFVLFSFDDLESEWTVETATAFGFAPWYYGARSMAVYKGQLLMGTAGAAPCVVFSAVSKAP
eukprot:GHVS01060058.1.p2 GENE.GHVS01060058.1~~GHVS01060058.1.p2  ORF type:complete len:247 (+),score=17.74 GHVS01060058.1:1065-1805(+)